MPSVACLVVVELNVHLVSLICSLLLVDAVTAVICCQSRVDQNVAYALKTMNGSHR